MTSQNAFGGMAARVEPVTRAALLELRRLIAAGVPLTGSGTGTSITDGGTAANTGFSLFDGGAA